MSNQLPPDDSFDKSNPDGSSSDGFNPDGSSPDGSNPKPIRPEPEPEPASDGVGGRVRSSHLDGSVRDMLRLLGLARCRADTSVAITMFARSVSPELFEAVLDMLLEVKPLWDRLIEKRGTRVMAEFLDEFVWVVKNLRCPHAPPKEVAKHIGIAMVLDFGAVLAKRQRI